MAAHSQELLYRPCSRYSVLPLVQAILILLPVALLGPLPLSCINNSYTDSMATQGFQASLCDMAFNFFLPHDSVLYRLNLLHIAQKSEVPVVLMSRVIDASQ